MSILSRRLSVPELSQRILEMGQTGVYRESIFEALQPVATKSHIRQAIAHAKKFGLHSVASLRDAELGTYYQVDGVKYRSLSHLINSAAHQGSEADLMNRVTETTRSVQRMLRVAQVVAGLLVGGGVLTWVTGWHLISFGLLGGATSALGLWVLQKSLIGKQEQ